MRAPAEALRTELCARAAEYASAAGLECYVSNGEPGVTLFPQAANGLAHGNFHPRSFAAIKANPSWALRLTKPHTRRRRALPTPYDEDAKELDSCTSSDALLMNCFCFPGILHDAMAILFGVQPDSPPHFGVPGEVPLDGGATDSTEVDMRIGLVNVEAKLTERDFTQKPIPHVERYANLYKVFERQALPRVNGGYGGYQLIRNVLAIASNPDKRFVVVVDARRPDLLREWWAVHSAIQVGELRQRCSFVLWQEVAEAAPVDLRDFLRVKYGL